MLLVMLLVKNVKLVLNVRDVSLVKDIPLVIHHAILLVIHHVIHHVIHLLVQHNSKNLIFYKKYYIIYIESEREIKNSLTHILGCSVKVSAAVSKTVGLGSNPNTPAI